jgi:cyclopropane fatty-acyl-phospholipid synthase-like methyltransferase
MVIVTLQKIIDERISFLKEQINLENKPEVSKTFHTQTDAIRSVDNIEKVGCIICKRYFSNSNSALCIASSIFDLLIERIPTASGAEP